ncbi:hypothetical protein [Streptomyces sp. NPDC127072]|uniref:hypothetical protein n=1 Tax=Streptomyces sp. NPDC127072 TaxID=3347129 RepID=UPI00364A0A69
MIRQLVGQRAALNVTADAEPIPRAQADALVEPNRLAWCLVGLRSGGVELRWQCRNRKPCQHGAVIQHRCPEGTPLGRRPEGALW